MGKDNVTIISVVCGEKTDSSFRNLPIERKVSLSVLLLVLFLTSWLQATLVFMIMGAMALLGAFPERQTTQYTCAMSG